MSIIKGLFSRKPTSDQQSGAEDLAALFKRYYDPLVYFSSQFVKDKCKAQDIAQEVFIKYWEQKETISDDQAAIRNFLYSSVKNASLNVVRHEKVVDSYIVLQGNAEPAETSVMEALITAEVTAEIHAALQSLPEHYRIISMMGYFDGKKNQEIADELAMSVNTVKKQKQKALQLLRLRLSPEMFLLAGALCTQMHSSLLHFFEK